MEHRINVRPEEAAAPVLDEIRGMAEAFCERWRDVPASGLNLTINHHARSNDFHVKATASLPSGREFTGARGGELPFLVGDCLDKLSRKVEARITQMSGQGAFADARRDRLEAALPDPDGLRAAADRGDAVAFRQILSAYDESLGKILKAKIGQTGALAKEGDPGRLTGLALDLLSLTAFDEFDRRPKALFFRDWLFSLTDEVVHELALRRDAIEEEISQFRSAGGGDT